MVGLAVLGVGADGLAGPYVGLFTLCFTYLGLTQPAGSGLRLAPVAVAGYLAAYGGWSAVLLPRLLIAVPVWLLLAELLADLRSRQQLLADELQAAAHTDALTGLANRRDLDLRLPAARNGDTVVLCDLDHFKHLNDTAGHQAGDRVLAEFGALLRSTLRHGDYPARYGGEEFVVLLPTTSPAAAGTVLARLHQQWAVLQSVTFSAGLAQIRPDRPPTAALLAADRALYTAKNLGRDRDHNADTPPAPPAPSPAPMARPT